MIALDSVLIFKGEIARACGGVEGGTEAFGDVSLLAFSIKYEPPHDKTNKMTFTPSEDSDQPWHLPSLIRVYAVHSKGSQGPKASLCGQRSL